MINSSIIYLFSYLFVYLLNQLISLEIAHLLHIPGKLYYYEVFFINNDSWSVFNALMVSNAGLFLIFFLGIAILGRVKISEAMRPYFRMFLLWFSFHCVNLLLGGIYCQEPLPGLARAM